MPGVVLVRQLDVIARPRGGAKGWLVATLASALLIVPYSLVAGPQGPKSTAPLDRMTAEDRVATGVERLTSAELEALNRWLAQQLGTSIDVNSVKGPVSASDVLTPPEAETADSIADAQAVSPSTEQSAVIEAEVARRVAKELAAARADDQAVEISEPFEARVLGGFNGWSGKTVFTLDNGQVWRQRHDTSYRYQGTDNRVRLEPNFFGFWEMTVVSTGRSVGVRRID